MTWNEFKTTVEAEIRAAGFDGKISIAAIKVSRTGRDGIDIAITEPDRGPEAALQVWNT